MEDFKPNPLGTMAAHTLGTFPWKVGVHAYVVNAYVNGNIVESHFKAVRSRKKENMYPISASGKEGKLKLIFTVKI